MLLWKTREHVCAERDILWGCHSRGGKERENKLRKKSHELLDKILKDGWTGPSTGPKWHFKPWASTREFQSDKLNHHFLTAEQWLFPLKWSFFSSTTSSLSCFPPVLAAFTTLMIEIVSKENTAWTSERKNTSSVYSLIYVQVTLGVWLSAGIWGKTQHLPQHKSSAWGTWATR